MGRHQDAAVMTLTVVFVEHTTCAIAPHLETLHSCQGERSRCRCKCCGVGT